MDLGKLETELKIRGLSKDTLKAYIAHNTHFLTFIGKDPATVDQDDIKSYLAHLISDKGLSSASVALARSSILFFYNQVLNKDFHAIKTPKIERRTPDVLSKLEVKKLLGACYTEKSRLLLEILYSSGLRVSECVSLKVSDLDFDEGVCMVKQGKGKKDRATLLSAALGEKIEAFMAKKNITDGFIFRNKKGAKMSSRNVQKIVKGAAKRAGIKKIVTPHKLRHCFATHLLEAGISIRIIQELLGHSNLQTTQIYTRVSRESIKKVKSPLDDI